MAYVTNPDYPSGKITVTALISRLHQRAMVSCTEFQLEDHRFAELLGETCLELPKAEQQVLLDAVGMSLSDILVCQDLRFVLAEIAQL